MLQVTDEDKGAVKSGCGCAGGGGDQAAMRKAGLYALLAAGGWVFESKWAFAIGIGGLIGAVVDVISERSGSNGREVVGQVP